MQVLTDWFAQKNVDNSVIFVTIFITGTNQVRSITNYNIYIGWSYNTGIGIVYQVWNIDEICNNKKRFLSLVKNTKTGQVLHKFGFSLIWSG